MKNTQDLLDKYSLDRDKIIEEINFSPSVSKEIKEIVGMIREVILRDEGSLEKRYYFLKVGASFRGLYEKVVEINKNYTQKLEEKCNEIICKNLNECEKKCNEFSGKVGEYRGEVWKEKTIEVCNSLFRKIINNLDCEEFHEILKTIYGEISKVFHSFKEHEIDSQREIEIMDNILFFIYLVVKTVKY